MQINEFEDSIDGFQKAYNVVVYNWVTETMSVFGIAGNMER